MVKKYVFRFNGESVFETEHSNEIDVFVDDWLDENFNILNEYSNYLLTKDNYEEYAEDFKSEFIVEVE